MDHDAVPMQSVGEKLLFAVTRTRCAVCGAAGVIEQTIRGRAITFEWRCTACQRVWPVSETLVNRRSGPPDRRRKTRNERRRS